MDAWGRRGKLLRVVETIEPEFDLNERDNWYALWEYEQALCPHCGLLRSVCQDPNTDFYPQLNRCWAMAATQMVGRKWHKKNEKASPDAVGYLPTDGASVWVSTEDLSPGDDFV